MREELFLSANGQNPKSVMTLLTASLLLLVLNSLGIKPTNYIGDVFGTLGGTPNFG